MFDTPGVYTRILPSGVRPIAGVSTSNTAFVGFLERGPVNRATRITSFGEFERIFGGLNADFESSYAVRAYFQNGGAVAFVIRVVSGADADGPDESAAALTNLSFTAASVGAWGDNLRVGVAMSSDTSVPLTILVREFAGDAVVREEIFANLSITEGTPRYVETLVQAESELITVSHTDGAVPVGTGVPDGAGGEIPATTVDQLREAPAASLQPFTDGADGILPENSAAGFGALAAISGSSGDGTELNPPTGIHALDTIAPQIFNIMVLADLRVIEHANRTNSAAIYQEANTYCRQNLAFLLVDTPRDTRRNTIPEWVTSLGSAVGRNSAMYYPPLSIPDPLIPGTPRVIASSGVVAGLYARTDAERGVWKAPAGIGTPVIGTPIDLMTDAQQGPLNAGLAVNVIRTFPVYNSVIWGARTLFGADARASEWRYVSVVRLALFIERSLKDGLQFAVFEGNDEPLWSTVRLSAGAFMSQLHRQGAFQGASARDAWFVQCDEKTTTQADINLGIMNVLVGFAPLQTAEFIVISIQQQVDMAV